MLNLRGLHVHEGDRVVLQGDHPWATYAGTVVGWEFVDLYRAEFPKVQLDIGHSIFVFRAGDVRKTTQ